MCVKNIDSIETFKPIDFKFNLGRTVKTIDGKIGKVCIQISNRYGNTYGISIDKKEIYHELKESDLSLIREKCNFV